jgi:hypothetical protein
VHALPVHDCPVWHIVPQAPQLLPSRRVSVHAPLQSVWPAAHAHAPPVHVCPAGQRVPQVPQLLESICVSVQVPRHSV